MQLDIPQTRCTYGVRFHFAASRRYRTLVAKVSLWDGPKPVMWFVLDCVPDLRPIFQADYWRAKA